MQSFYDAVSFVGTSESFIKTLKTSHLRKLQDTTLNGSDLPQTLHRKPPTSFGVKVHFINVPRVLILSGAVEAHGGAAAPSF